MATVSVAEFATAIDTDPRTARKFLRTITPKDAQPGKGSRWAIEKKDIRSMKSQFAKFEAAQAAKASAKEVKEVEEEVIESEDFIMTETD